MGEKRKITEQGEDSGAIKIHIYRDGMQAQRHRGDG